ncbi:MAG: HAD-IA family hydrolase, partial [Acidobacteria bacterium]|nr:HAD-IA family hydrolase [Acidobacteriota bacterium]
EFRRLFISRADEVMVDSTVVYPWVPRTARTLRQAGLALGIVSTKRRQRIEEVLIRDGLEGLFSVVVGSDSVPRPKPAPDGLLLALEHLGTSAEEALFVGDSTTDADAAQRAAVPFVAVLTGATAREAFRGYPCRAVLPNASGILSHLELPG